MQGLMKSLGIGVKRFGRYGGATVGNIREKRGNCEKGNGDGNVNLHCDVDVEEEKRCEKFGGEWRRNGRGRSKRRFGVKWVKFEGL